MFFDIRYKILIRYYLQKQNKYTFRTVRRSVGVPVRYDLRSMTVMQPECSIFLWFPMHRSEPKGSLPVNRSSLLIRTYYHHSVTALL